MIKVTDFKFDFSKKDGTWFGDSLVLSSYFQALSCLFNEGELYFIQSVRAYRKGLPPLLEADVKAFIGQEANHRKAHSSFDEGYEDLEKFVGKLLQGVTSKLHISERYSLLFTCGLEHLTATLGKCLLEDANAQKLMKWPEGSEEARLWLEHAYQELEHASVTFDVYKHHYPKESFIKYLERVGIYSLGLIGIFAILHVFTVLIIDRNTEDDLSLDDIAFALRFLYEKDAGFITRNIPALKAYYSRSYNTRHNLPKVSALLSKWRGKLFGASL